MDRISDVLDSSTGEILLQGIGLREFFGGDKGYADILRKMLNENRKIQIKALLVNPNSEFAKARAIAEDGMVFDDDEVLSQVHFIVIVEKYEYDCVYQKKILRSF